MTTWMLLAIIAGLVLFNVPATKPHAQRLATLTWSWLKSFKIKLWMVIVAILITALAWPQGLTMVRNRAVTAWDAINAPTAQVPAPAAPIPAPAPKQDDKKSAAPSAPPAQPAPQVIKETIIKEVSGPTKEVVKEVPTGLACGSGTHASNGQCVPTNPQVANKLQVGEISVSEVSTSEALISFPASTSGGRSDFSLFISQPAGGWVKVSDHALFNDGVVPIKKRVTGLAADTSYEVKVVYSDRNVATKTFTTKKAAVSTPPPKQDSPPPTVSRVPFIMGINDADNQPGMHQVVLGGAAPASAFIRSCPNKNLSLTAAGCQVVKVNGWREGESVILTLEHTYVQAVWTTDSGQVMTVTNRKTGQVETFTVSVSEFYER